MLNAGTSTVYGRMMHDATSHTQQAQCSSMGSASSPHQIGQQARRILEVLRVGDAEVEPAPHVLQVGLQAVAQMVVEQAAPGVPHLPAVCLAAWARLSAICAPTHAMLSCRVPP